MAEPEPPTLYAARLIVSGQHGDTFVTREAVEGAARQLAEQVLPVSVEHDPTKPPVGRILNGHLTELDNGEVAVDATMEVRADNSIPATFHPESAFRQVQVGLPDIAPQAGPLTLDIDPRSYQREDVKGLRAIAAAVGETSAKADVARFSLLPDALLTLELGAAGAVWWFGKGFFTRLGEHAADDTYERFKTAVKLMIGRRTPADQPPITIIKLSIQGDAAQTVEIEGSSRAEGDDVDDFLDAGEDLLLLSRVYAQMVPEPGRLTKLHFEWIEGLWKLRYGLDVDTQPVIALALSDIDFDKLVKQARAEERDN